MVQLPPTAEAYVRSINDHDPAAFIALFADERRCERCRPGVPRPRRDQGLE